MNVYLGIGIPWLAAAIYWASASGVKTSANPGLKTQPTRGDWQRTRWKTGRQDILSGGLGKLLESVTLEDFFSHFISQLFMMKFMFSSVLCCAQAELGVDFIAKYSNGAFVVQGGALGFSVLLFNCVAITCLAS